MARQFMPNSPSPPRGMICSFASAMVQESFFRLRPLSGARWRPCSGQDQDLQMAYRESRCLGAGWEVAVLDRPSTPRAEVKRQDNSLSGWEMVRLAQCGEERPGDLACKSPDF